MHAIVPTNHRLQYHRKLISPELMEWRWSYLKSI